MSKTCLACKHMSEPESPHKWHQCEWASTVKMPQCALVTWYPINIRDPFANCPTWEPREKEQE